MAKVKILFLASNPVEQSRLALDEEIRAITAQIRASDHRDSLEVVSGWAVRPDDLQQLLLEHKPHIVHFSGHGTRDAPSSVTPPRNLSSARDMIISHVCHVEQFVLMGEGGQAHPMSKAALVDLFYALRADVRLVVLNACHSEPFAEALAEVIPCTIGMRGAITDDAAIAFAAAFYRGLGFGRSIQEAFDLGKNAAMNLPIPEDQAPRLYSLKGAGDPAKVVLVGPSIGSSRRLAAGADRNRLAMLEKVHRIWITGFLEQSLFQDTRILLGLSERTEIVARPLDLLVKRPDQGERPLPSGTQVVDVYDTMDQAILILGAPGSGKTTLLLDLARELLTRAAHDSEHPIPVVFPLSTWAESRKPLAEWLMDELNLRYDVPSQLAREWVVTDAVLPLLDGLDEVKEEHRTACVQACNVFRQSRGFLPLVITSRLADYEALAEKLRLHGAILVQPLTREQVNDYLVDLGPAAASVRAALREDRSLWELLDTPMLLNIVTVAYSEQTGASLPVSGTMAERRDHLFGSYVKQMLQRRAAEHRYTPERTVHWLSWLASQMGKHGQTVFYLERLQLDWLPRRPRWAIIVCNALIGGLVGGLGVALIGGLVGGLRSGLAIGLVIGLVDGLVGGLSDGLAFGRLLGPVGGLVGGLGVGLSSMLDQDTCCVETVRWSWPTFRNNFWFGGLIGGSVALLFGVFFGVLFGLYAGLVVGLVGGLASWAFGGFFSGLTFGEIETRVVPNEGIRRSARNAFFVLLVVVPFGVLYGELVFGVLDALRVWLEVRLPFGLRGGRWAIRPSIGLVVGLIVGLVVGLQAGGEACLKHFVLRLRLIRNGSTPWNYVRFLDHAAERILLRKVGGGYAFLHRMLLDYFAATIR